MSRRPTEEIPEETASNLNPNLIAVAPFENRTGNAELDDLGLVAADWLTNALARIDAIDVVPIGLGVESRVGVTSPLEVSDATGAGIVVTGAYTLAKHSRSSRPSTTPASGREQVHAPCLSR